MSLSHLLLLALAACSGSDADRPDGPRAQPRAQPVERPLPPPPPPPPPDAPVQARVLTGPVDVVRPVPSQTTPPDRALASEEIEPNDSRQTATPLPPDGSLRGHLEPREKDFVLLDVTEPSVWRIEVDGASSVEVFGGADRRLAESRRTDDGRQRVSDLYLLPGKYWVVVWNRDVTDYHLWAANLGPPGPRMEREPNDDTSRAMPLVFGEARTGSLAEPADRDEYRFSVPGDGYYRVTWLPPSAVRTKLALTEILGGETLLAGEVAATEHPVSWDLWLPPGEYTLAVRVAAGAGTDPYVVRVDRLDPFVLPDDLEPNDDVRDAARLPSDGVIRGGLGPLDATDWYALPSSSLDTPVRISLAGEGWPRDALRVYDAAGKTRLAFDWDDEDTLVGVIPGGQAARLRVTRLDAYTVTVVSGTGARDPRPAPAQLSVGVDVDALQVAAFWHEGQRLAVPVRVRNPGPGEQTVQVSAATGHDRWQPIPLPPQRLSAGQTATLSVPIEVADDAWDDQPVQVTIAASVNAGIPATTTVVAHAVCGAEPVEPFPWRPLPEALLGGVNVAAAGFGGLVVKTPRAGDHLNDGFTPNTGGFRAQLPVELAFDLAGSAPVPVAGLVLSSKTNEGTVRDPIPFTLELSTDGQSYAPALSGVVERTVYEQPFALDRPVQATHARLLFPVLAEGARDNLYLGEVKVVADPGARPLGDMPNLADPRHGGQVVYMRPHDGAAARMLSEDKDTPQPMLDPLQPVEWVIGFEHHRAARIAALEWVTHRDGVYRDFSTVQVAVSTDSPVGPWTPLGTWDVDPTPGAATRWDLPAPSWARYVRFTNTEAQTRERWDFPDPIRVFEAPADDTYRSVLGEWGQYRTAAVYEQTVGSPAPVAMPGADDDDTRDTATLLRPGAPAAGEVAVGVDEDWYRIDVPDGHNRLAVAARGFPTLIARLSLSDGAGDEVPLRQSLDGWQAEVAGGASYWLRVDEPPRNIALSWDNSGSVAGYYDTIYEAVGRFGAGIEPGRETANLLPFQGPEGRFLLGEWTDQPSVLQAAMTEYDRHDSSSQAEYALLTATRELAGREGTPAILLITDAETHSADKNGELWQRFAQVRPRVFTIELHIGKVGWHQDLMQGWSRVDAGHYTWFATHADVDVAFKRAACHLRRPARYELSAGTRHEAPPPPGRIAVDVSEALAQGGLEVVLDASGSMAARMGDSRRIDIARSVLSDLVRDAIPAGTPVALRVFGHREPRSCGTWLEVPPGPLDPDAMAATIARVEPQDRSRTPLGASLQAIATDLAGVEGTKRVVVLTDGEETCDGDPAGAIAALKEAGFDVRVNIVGFAIDDAALKEDFATWAAAGGGRYYDAGSGEELAAAMGEALRPKFQVLDAGGQQVAEGTAGGEAVDVPAGTYTIKVLTAPPVRFAEIVVPSGREVRLDAGAQ